MLVVITGTSSGIGKAIAEKYLKQGYSVIGISRKHTLVHELYTAVQCDLSDSKAIEKLPVQQWVNQPVLLINNAGMLGEVKRLSDQEENILDEVFAVNTIAPGLLMRLFVRACGDRFPLTVVNISSGAAKRAIPSWAAYCASKAALDMLSLAFYLEEQEKGRSTKVYSVAPGVVHTPMQALIRKTNKEDFSAVNQFVDYYENDELILPEIVADKLQKLLDLPYDSAVIYSLREIS